MVAASGELRVYGARLGLARVGGFSRKRKRQLRDEIKSVLFSKEYTMLPRFNIVSKSAVR